MTRKRYDTSDSSTDSDGASDADGPSSRPRKGGTIPAIAWVLLLLLVLVVAGTLGATTALEDPPDSSSSAVRETADSNDSDNAAAEAPTRAEGPVGTAATERPVASPSKLSAQSVTGSTSPGTPKPSSSGSSGAALKLLRSHEGESFLEGWEFFHLADPTEVRGAGLVDRPCDLPHRLLC